MTRKLIIQVLDGSGSPIVFTTDPSNKDVRMRRVNESGTVESAAITWSTAPTKAANGVVVFDMLSGDIYPSTITDAYKSGWFQIQYTIDATSGTPTWVDIVGWNPGYFDIDPFTYKEIQDLKTISSLITTQYGATPDPVASHLTLSVVGQGIKVYTSRTETIGMKVYFKESSAPDSSSDYIYINGNSGFIYFDSSKEGDNIFVGVKYVNGLWQESTILLDRHRQMSLLI